ALQQQFRERETKKLYQALVWGTWPPSLKVIDEPLLKSTDAAGERHVRVVPSGHEQARRSITLVKLRRQFAGVALLDVTLKTGRTHQIRVHLAHAGHAIVGDPKYGDFAANKAFAREPRGAGQRFARMFLHARELGFEHPASGEHITVVAPLPAECETLLASLAAAATTGRSAAPPAAPPSPAP
ncbi:MAG: RluA family pseudouridine synthase, partial [Rubrivivax sp.]